MAILLQPLLARISIILRIALALARPTSWRIINLLTLITCNQSKFPVLARR